MTTTLNTPLRRAARVDPSKVWRVGGLAILASAVANAVVYFIASALVRFPPEFPPLASVVPPILFTVMFTLVAVVVFAVVARRSSQPVRLYRIIAVVALILSFIPDLTLPGNPMFPGATPAAIGTLVVMHFVAAAITVYLLTTQTLEV